MDRSEEGVVERPSGRTADPRPSVAQGVAETPTPRAGGGGQELQDRTSRDAEWS